MLGRKTLNASTLALVLVLALATIGVGYGLWFKELNILGTVYTGEVNAVLSIEEVDESRSFDALYCPNGGGYSIGKDCDEDGSVSDSIGMEFEGKNVASCTANLVSGGQFPDAENDGPQGMLVTIRNAYPSFNCFIQIDVTNAGTIPIKVHTPVAYVWDGGAWVELTGGVGFGGNYGSGVAPAWPYIFHLNSWPPTVDGATCYADDTQIHRGEKVLCNLHFHLGQLAEQNATYQWWVNIFAHQWNEEPAP